jgi:hypothetical protein
MGTYDGADNKWAMDTSDIRLTDVHSFGEKHTLLYGATTRARVGAQAPSKATVPSWKTTVSGVPSSPIGRTPTSGKRPSGQGAGRSGCAAAGAANAMSASRRHERMKVRIAFAYRRPTARVNRRADGQSGVSLHDGATRWCGCCVRHDSQEAAPGQGSAR